MNYLINDINDLLDNSKNYFSKKLFFEKDRTADFVLGAGIINIAVFFALLKPWGSLSSAAAASVFILTAYLVFYWSVIPLIDFTAFKLFGKTALSNITGLSKYLFTPFLFLLAGSYVFNSNNSKIFYFLFLCVISFGIFAKILGVCYKKETIEILFFIISFFAFYSIMILFFVFFFSLMIVT